MITVMCYDLQGCCMESPGILLPMFRYEAPVSFSRVQMFSSTDTLCRNVGNQMQRQQRNVSANSRFNYTVAKA